MHLKHAGGSGWHWKNAENRKVFLDARSITSFLKFPHVFIMCITFFFFSKPLLLCNLKCIKKNSNGCSGLKSYNGWFSLFCRHWINLLNGWAIWMLPTKLSFVWWVGEISMGNAIFHDLFSSLWPGDTSHLWMMSYLAVPPLALCTGPINMPILNPAQGDLNFGTNFWPFTPPFFFSVLDSSDIILSYFLSFTVSQSLLSRVLLLSLPSRERWSIYKYEPRDSFHCRYLKYLFGGNKKESNLPLF